MSTDTANYGFTKDNEDDFYNVNVVNANLDKIDTEMKRIEDESKSFNEQVTDNTNAIANANTKLDTHIVDYVKHPGYGVTTFSSPTYSVTLSPAPTQYVDGMGIVLRLNADQIAGNAAINVNNLGAKNIISSKGFSVKNLKKDAIYSFRYSAAKGAFILQGEGGEYGNATENDVATGKTFGTDEGLKTGAATISKLPPFMPNKQKVYTSGELRSWNHLSSPVYARDGLFAISATNTPDNVYAVKVFRLYNGGYSSILDSSVYPFLNATVFRDSWHYDNAAWTLYSGSLSTGISIWQITSTAMNHAGTVTAAKACGSSVSGIMYDGFLYTIERQAGITYLHKMNAPLAGNPGGLVQSFSVPLDAYTSTINVSYTWRVQLIDGYVMFTRTDYGEVRIYDLKLTLVKTITANYGTGQDAILIDANIMGLLSSTIVYDRNNGVLGFKNTGLQPYYANIHTYPYNWITSNG
ncbi:hypothetical protein [Lysinibacillus sp. FSL W7-1291]|uniref:hypothetical protein n=1 Tax=Lysinibacillus sp. FSL W7-1291 TaxID=2954544 RepID=UPI003159962B